MTYDDSKRYRRLQKIGLVLTGIAYFYGIVLFYRLQSWTVPAILAVIMVSIIILNYRAAKMEVLSVLDISLTTYERMVLKQKARKVRR